jgi:hypothetical protein
MKPKAKSEKRKAKSKKQKAKSKKQKATKHPRGIETIPSKQGAALG